MEGPGLVPSARPHVILRRIRPLRFLPQDIEDVQLGPEWWKILGETRMQRFYGASLFSRQRGLENDVAVDIARTTAIREYRRPVHVDAMEIFSQHFPHADHELVGEHPNVLRQFFERYDRHDSLHGGITL
jgi:hypothetical protein